MAYETWMVRWDTFKEERPQIAGSPDDPSRFAAGLPGNDPGRGSFAVFDGYLFDQEAPDAACLLYAYQRYGEGLFGRLRGGFALAVWDEARRLLVAGRDALGIQPLYYYWDCRVFLLSPDLDRILAQPEVSGEVNRVVLAEYLACTWHAHQRCETFYAGVQRLPAAHRLCLDRWRLGTERYWDPLPPGFDWASEAELEAFPWLLERAVGRCLAGGADSLALSGGFDSVSIAVLAAEQLRGKPPLHAVSLRFTLGAVDEGQTQTAVARALGMPQVMRTVEDCLEGISFVEASLALSKSSPLPVLSQWQVMYTALLDSAAALGLRGLMLGTGGDEMLAVDLAYGADLLAGSDLRGLWRYYRAMVRTSPFSPLFVARVVLWDGAAVPVGVPRLRAALERVSPGLVARLRRRRREERPWLACEDPELRRTLTCRLLDPVEDEAAPGEGAYVRKLRGLLLSPLFMAEQEQGDSWARQTGFNMFYPYLDRDLVDLALRMHPEHLIAGGRAKWPVRQLVAERLPEVPLPAKKVDFSSPVHVLLRKQGCDAWRHLGGPQRLAGLGIVDPGRLNPLIEDYFAGRNNAWLRTWLVLSAETWLRARVLARAG